MPTTVHLIDGTYELFRCYFGAPSSKTSDGREVGATRAILNTFHSFIRSGNVTHTAVAFDTVIESFRNRLFAGYKTGEGIDPGLFSQFPLAERATAALGMVVWSMVEFEADDALATGARLYSSEKGVTQVRLCTPDKDLAQCVIGKKIVGFDRHRDIVLDEEGVVQKFGVPPASIPDLLALVGDTADGIPGIERWGMKSAAAVLAAYGKVDAIPDDPAQWKVKVRGADALAQNLADAREEAKLYRRLATLRVDVPIKETLADLEWQGADRAALTAICAEIEDDGILSRITRWRGPARDALLI